MKKNYVGLLTSLVFFLLVITGCQKQTQDAPSGNETAGVDHQGSGNHDGERNKCRLVVATNSDPSGTADFVFDYNHRGLADEWDISNYGHFQQEYDNHGRLKKSVHTVDGIVVFTIRFFYNGNKLIKEILYFGSSTDVMDEAFYHYNGQGNLVKVQSFINDYVAIGKYNSDGNLKSSELLFSGVPVYSAFYKYNRHFKNPLLAVPGIDHGFPFYTPMDLFYGKWRWASLKQVAYDETGNPIVQFEYNPSQTQWQSGPRDYPGCANYYDVVSAAWFPYRWEFENCGGGHHNDRNANSTAPSLNRSVTNPIVALLQRNPAKSMKEQVKIFRQEIKKYKK